MLTAARLGLVAVESSEVRDEMSLMPGYYIRERFDFLSVLQRRLQAFSAGPAVSGYRVLSLAWGAVVTGNAQTLLKAHHFHDGAARVSNGLFKVLLADEAPGSDNVTDNRYPDVCPGGGACNCPCMSSPVVDVD